VLGIEQKALNTLGKHSTIEFSHKPNPSYFYNLFFSLEKVAEKQLRPSDVLRRKIPRYKEEKLVREKARIPVVLCRS
jgi:hypothetical protein